MGWQRDVRAGQYQCVDDGVSCRRGGGDGVGMDEDWVGGGRTWGMKQADGERKERQKSHAR